MKSFNWKKTIPYICAIVLFFVIAVVYSSPVLEGKTLLGHDTESWAYSAKEARDYNATHNEPTLWTNSMFGGMPTYQITMPRNYNLVGYLQTILQTLLPDAVFFVFLYLVCFYILMLCLGLSPWLALTGSIAFTFASYNFIIIAAGHITKVITIAYMAPLIGGIYVAFRRNKYVGTALTAVFLSLAIRANHVQILYYTLILLIFFGVSEFIYQWKAHTLPYFFKSFGLLCAAAVLAIGMNATMLLTTYEYSKYTMRGPSNGLTITEAGEQHGLDKNYITQWSYGIGESLTALIPDIRGGASIGTLSKESATAQQLKNMGIRNIEKTMDELQLPLYWGTQPFTSGPVYFGAIVCFLFVLGLFIVDGRMKWWLLAAATLTLLLSWGRNFMPLTDIFIDYFPMYNKFRTVSMTLVVTGFCVATIAMLALKTVFSDSLDTKKKRTSLYISAGITGGICLLFALFPSIAGNFVSPTDTQMQGDYAFLRHTLPIDRAAMLRSDAWRSFLFIALAFGGLFLFLQKKWNKKWFYLFFGILFLADMYPVCRRYLNNDNFRKADIEQLRKPSTADRIVLQDKTYYRVLDASVDIFNDASPAYFHKNIGGYHAAKLRRYQELIDVHLSKEIALSMQNAKTTADITDNLKTSNVLNMLNMKYLIYNKNAEPILNPHANGAAWIINRYRIAQNADEEMLALAQIDPKTESVIDKEFADYLPDDLTYDSTANIILTSYAPNNLKYQSNTTKEQIAVFSEIYYDKGWNAYIDGEKTQYIRADYLLRALRIPAGNHQIEFRFEPKSFYIGNGIAIAASVLFVVMIALLIGCYYHKKRKHVN